MDEWLPKDRTGVSNQDVRIALFYSTLTSEIATFGRRMLMLQAK